MSMSPQSGGFQRCTGAGPRPFRAVASPSPFSAPSGGVSAFAIFWRLFVGEEVVDGMVRALLEKAPTYCNAPAAKAKPDAGFYGREGRQHERDQCRAGSADPGRR